MVDECSSCEGVGAIQTIMGGRPPRCTAASCDSYRGAQPITHRRQDSLRNKTFVELSAANGL